MLVILHVQVLSQVTPNPNDVKREVAQRFPKKNRSEDFLPRESQCYNRCYFHHCFLFLSAADKHRVILKGELSDYIHATYVNVSLFVIKRFFFCCVRATSTRRHL